MASGLFNQFKEQVMQGTHDWVTDTIWVLLVDNGYTFDPTEEFVSDLTPGEELNTGGDLTTNYVRKLVPNRTVVIDSPNVRIKADDVVWTSLGNGNNQTIGGAIIYDYNGGVDAGARMIAFLDTSNILTQGVDVTLSFDATNGIWYF